MDSTTENLFSSAEKAKSELETAIKLGEATYTNIEHLLASYRSASENLVFHDYALASSECTEQQLWKCHCDVNNIFRKKLATFKTAEGKKKPVERRKMEMRYVTFIKSSQSFYRGFIRRLASRFANITELLEAARKIKDDTVPVDEPLVVDAAQEQLVLQSCHSSLVQLGDLSRYRETELKLNNRNWGPAKGYYSLAITILPTSGVPYHQLAAIAQTDQDIFESVYYFYRALMQQVPHPNARKNLEIQLRKVCTRWEKSENHNVKDGYFTHFPSRFIAFHAHCYFGADFIEHRDLETELIHEVTVTLLQRPDGNLLNKICMINIAAEAAALDRYATEAHESSLHSFRLFQLFNVKLVSELLRVLVVELHRIEKLVRSSEMEDKDKLTPFVRCLLPPLRQYSSWLLAEIPHLVFPDSQGKDSGASVSQIQLASILQELWPIYVDALAALAKTYPLRGGKALNYLLAEDEDSIAFKPFEDETVRTRYLNEAGNIKTRSTNLGVPKEEPSEEMLHRVRQIVKDGIFIAKATDPKRIAPVRLQEGRFVCPQPESSVEDADIRGQLESSQPLPGFLKTCPSLPPGPGPDETLHSIDTEMREMVDDLVQERRPEPARPRKSGNERASKTKFTAADLVKQIQRSSHSPSLQSPISHTAEDITDSSLLPSGLQDSAIRLGSAHASQPQTPANPLYASSGHSFTNRLIRQQQEIHARSSPQQSLPPPSSWYDETPTGFNSLLNAQSRHQRSPTWTTPLETGDEEIKKPLPRKNLFGAIGETPGRTPTSAQPD